MEKDDEIWECVKRVENGCYRCIYCQHDFAGSVSLTRIKYHLSKKRNGGTKICPKVPKDVQEKAYQAIEAPNKKGRTLSCSNNAEKNETIPTSLPSSSKGSLHQSITSKVGKKDKSEVDEQLAKFIKVSELDFHVIENPFFAYFLKSVAEFGPSYKLPKFATLQSQMIPKIQQEVNKHIENIKNSISSTGYTVMLDLRGSYDHAYNEVNIFVYTLEGAMLIGIVEWYEDDDFVENVCLKVNSFDHTKPVQFIITSEFEYSVELAGDDSDGAAYKSIKDMLIEKYPTTYVTRCVAEEIQSLLKAIYRQVPWVWKTIHLAYVIVKYLYQHHIDLSLQKEQLRSKNYGSIEFGQIASKFLMLTSILKVERGLQALQLSIASLSCARKSQLALTKDVAKVVDSAIHSDDFWTRGKEVVQLLMPIFRVLRLVDGNGPTPYLYEAMGRAETAITQNCGQNQVHYEVIREIFKSKRSHIIHPIHAAAAVLNPTYVFSQNVREENEMEEGINYISELWVHANLKEIFMEEVQLYRMKDPKMFRDTSVRLLKTCHPGIWWENFGDCLFTLQRYANRILSQPCSLSLCELDYLRHEEDYLMIEDYNDQYDDDDRNFRINLMMMEKFRMQGLEPINLDEIPGLPECEPENNLTNFDDIFEGKWPLEDYQGLLTIDDPVLL